MSVNPQAVEVNEDSNMAQIADAIRHNGQQVTEAQTVESTTVVEKQVAHAQETEGAKQEASLSTRISGAGVSLKAPGSNRASVYGDAAMEAAGAGPVLQMAKMAMEIIKDGGVPKEFQGMTTMEGFASGQSAKKSNSTQDILGGDKKGKSIRTKHSFDVASRGEANGLNDNAWKTNGISGKKGATAELSKKLEQTNSVKLLSEKQLGHAKQMEAVVGAKIAKAQQFGIAPGMVHDRMKQGPKFVEPKEEVVEDDSSSWA